MTLAGPLETVLRPIADALNRNISETTPARELAARLDDCCVAIRVKDSALAAYFLISDSTIDLRMETDVEPTVAITGSLFTLLRMLGSDGEDAIRSGDVELTGDAATAQRFQQLLGYARPDFEEELSRVVGDVAAHRIGSIARGIGDWAREARATMGSNIREYLQEESRDVPSRYEVEAFSEAVGTLRDDVERAAARLSRLEGRRE